ncbi:HlyD family efflux transporter periplasmic adaptor subunit [Acinetobacter wanghuae]|uniref:HlyD family efflux transporter periplasmic adaptor subunit n=1 Tax=Acinetobacter wanghuae TaxID=2662362 RepID=A0A5Q0P079_9GAMM|nr:HlyD family efflux transporter periplasmic adaptor subunit [Acinetobacter wanghuae]MQW92221.1 HlyD family efflux transporter periplasmic adaptor subunit [Acinetobacter wanghuae]QGA10469.1 HlyD family efflux transporter periplasmic adaptor subunit [Acinetobacter wanghuae]
MTDVQQPLPHAVADLQQEQQLKSKRKKALSIVAMLVLTALIIFAIWRVFFNSSVTTDNAYVGAETASVTSMVSGQVAEVLVSDTQTVKKGEVLLRIDARDTEIAVNQAQAELMKAKRQYKQTSANSGALNSQVGVSDDTIHSAEAQVAQAKAALDKAQDELARREKLTASGAISREELSTAQSVLNNAKAGYDLAQAGLAQARSSQKAAQSTLAANDALIQGSNENSTPDVQIAQAKLKQALLDLERTEIKAPFDGVISRRSIQVGQRVAPGNVLMMVVPVSQLYVDANFKESQLKQVRPGQKVTLISDLYGDDVEYTGTVVGFSGGTGSAFALIPAQNATGNWIKVVQRLPVRIQLDPKQLAEHPLRVGLSMEATVDLSKK